MTFFLRPDVFSNQRDPDFFSAKKVAASRISGNTLFFHELSTEIR